MEGGENHLGIGSSYDSGSNYGGKFSTNQKGLNGAHPRCCNCRLCFKAKHEAKEAKKAARLANAAAARKSGKSRNSRSSIGGYGMKKGK